MGIQSLSLANRISYPDSTYKNTNRNSYNQKHSGDKMATPKEKVDTLISDNLVMVFSKSSCPFCVKIKQLFSNLHIQIEVLELNQIADGSAVQAALAEKTGQRTVPNVFIGGQHIGGCDDTLKLHADGKLVPMVSPPQGGC